MSADVETLAGTSTQVGEPLGDRAEPTALLTAGAKLGRYLVLDVLGMGGMGIVVAAYDPQLDRKVAIKLVRPAVGGSLASAAEGGRMRLLREAQAMAKLAHPNVVAVHDVGTVDDQVFVAMEFIDGPSLRGWLAKPRSWRAVLEVFRQAGQGLNAAHQQGLIHRDFKPDNVMIGRDERVVVMDFGLVRASVRSEDSELPTEPRARVNDDVPTAPLDSHLTEVGSLLGTPAYMAPEQLAGNAADASSDQFSFCVALYEALYGERPFAGKSVVQLITSMMDGAIQPEPRATLVPRWLRAVVLRGLANQPEQRFASMHELLAALASDPSRRRRWLLGTFAGLAVILVVTGLALTATRVRTERTLADCERQGRAIDEIWTEQTQAALERSLTSTGSPFAQTSFAHMRTWLDPWAERWAKERTQVCVQANVEGSLGRELEAQAIECFDDQRERLATMLDVFANADARMVAGAVKAAAAFSQLESCADERTLAQRAVLPERLAHQSAPELGRVRQGLSRASALADAGDYMAAQVVANAAVDGATSLEWKPLEAEALLVRATIDSEIGDYTEVLVDLRRAYKLASSAGNDGLAAKAAISLLRVLGYHLARTDEGLAFADVAEPLLDRLGLGSGLDAAQLANNIGLVHETRGDFDQSEIWHRRALVLRESLLGADHPETGHSYANLGGLARLRGDLDAALRWHSRALEVRTQGLGPSHPDVARSHANLGRVYLARGQLDQALIHLDESYAILERTLGAEHRVAARVLDSIGEVHRERGELGVALDHHRRALAIQTTLLGANHPETAQSQLGIARVLLAQGQLELAATHVEATTAAFAELGPDHPSSKAVRALLDQLCTAGHEPACAKD